MYDIQLEINGKNLRMNPGSGYYISTISGLTGVTANLELSQSNSGIGESFSGGSVKGISLQVKGKILDGQTDKQQALLDTVVPLGTGTLSLYEKESEESGRAKPYRVFPAPAGVIPRTDVPDCAVCPRKARRRRRERGGVRDGLRTGRHCGGVYP